MDDRAVVCARSLVIGLGVVAGALAGVGRAQAPAPTTAPAPAGAGAQVPLELRPYRIRAVVAVDPRVRLDAAGLGGLLTEWGRMVDRFVGPPWALELEAATGAAAGRAPESLAPADLLPLAEGFDQVWLVRIGGAGGNGLRFSGRALDVQTTQLGPPRRRETKGLPDAGRVLFALGLELFTPRALIGEPDAGRVRVTVQGGALGAASPMGQVVAKGSVLVPLRLAIGNDGKVQRIVPIGWTYLAVDEVEGGTARCSIVSSLRDPLTRRVLGKSELVALGIRPAAGDLAFRFETRPPNPRPAAGYVLTVRTPPEGKPRIVGMTDRDGRITVPADPGASGPMLARLVAGDDEPLVEFPFLPGETQDERTLRVDPLTEAVALQAKLDALQDEVVDQVALRSRLQALLESRVQGNAWDDVRALLDQYRKLPGKQGFIDRLKQLRTAAEEQQNETKRPVLTRAAQAQLQDAETLITTYLDDEVFAAYQRAAQDAASGGVMLPSDEWKPFLVPGESFTVLVPGTPERSRNPLPIGAGRAPMRTFQLKAGERVFVVGVSEAGVAAQGRASLAPVRDALLANQPGARILASNDVTRAGLPGLEWRVEVKVPAAEGTPEATLQIRTQILAMAGGKVAVQSLVGPPEEVRGKEAETYFNSARVVPTGGAGRAAAKASSPPVEAATPAAGAAAPAAAETTPAVKKKAPPSAAGSTPF